MEDTNLSAATTIIYHGQLITDLIPKLHTELQVKDRFQKMHWYRQVFTGQEFVQYVQKFEYVVSYEDACSLGTQLIRMEHIKPMNVSTCNNLDDQDTGSHNKKEKMHVETRMRNDPTCYYRLAKLESFGEPKKSIPRSLSEIRFGKITAASPATSTSNIPAQPQKRSIWLSPNINNNAISRSSVDAGPFATKQHQQLSQSNRVDADLLRRKSDMSNDGSNITPGVTLPDRSVSDQVPGLNTIALQAALHAQGVDVSFNSARRQLQQFSSDIEEHKDDETKVPADVNYALDPFSLGSLQSFSPVTSVSASTAGARTVRDSSRVISKDSSVNTVAHGQAKLATSVRSPTHHTGRSGKNTKDALNASSRPHLPIHPNSSRLASYVMADFSDAHSSTSISVGSSVNMGNPASSTNSSGVIPPGSEAGDDASVLKRHTVSDIKAMPLSPRFLPLSPSKASGDHATCVAHEDAQRTTAEQHSASRRSGVLNRRNSGSKPQSNTAPETQRSNSPSKPVTRNSSSKLERNGTISSSGNAQEEGECVDDASFLSRKHSIAKSTSLLNVSVRRASRGSKRLSVSGGGSGHYKANEEECHEYNSDEEDLHIIGGKGGKTKTEVPWFS